MLCTIAQDFPSHRARSPCWEGPPCGSWPLLSWEWGPCWVCWYPFYPLFHISFFVMMGFISLIWEDMLMTEGLGIEAGREARPTNIYPQHMDVKPTIYAVQPQHHAPLHSSHSSHPSMSTNLGLSMNKSTGGEMEKIDNYFFASMLPNYGQVNVNVGNGEEGYPDFLTASPPPNLPLGNSSDFLNMWTSTAGVIAKRKFLLLIIIVVLDVDKGIGFSYSCCVFLVHLFIKVVHVYLLSTYQGRFLSSSFILSIQPIHLSKSFLIVSISCNCSPSNHL